MHPHRPKDAHFNEKVFCDVLLLPAFPAYCQMICGHCAAALPPLALLPPPIKICSPAALLLASSRVSKYQPTAPWILRPPWDYRWQQQNDDASATNKVMS